MSKPISICSKCGFPDTFKVHNKEEETFFCESCGNVEYAGDIKVLSPKEILIMNIVAFCALMESGAGIINKDPDYLLEKFNRFLQTDQPTWYWGLDRENRSIIYRYKSRWKRYFEEP